MKDKFPRNIDLDGIRVLIDALIQARDAGASFYAEGFIVIEDKDGSTRFNHVWLEELERLVTFLLYLPNHSR